MIAQQKVTQLNLSDEQYLSFIEIVDSIVNLRENERRSLHTLAIAKFFAQIPYICSQPNPDQKAVLNLVNYIVLSRCPEVFAARKNQTIRERVELLPILGGEDKELMSMCIDILEETSLMDHEHDQEDDLRNNHPNPINDKIIDFHSEKRRMEIRRLNYSDTLKEVLNDLNLDDFFWGWWRW